MAKKTRRAVLRSAAAGLGVSMLGTPVLGRQENSNHGRHGPESENIIFNAIKHLRRSRILASDARDAENPDERRRLQHRAEMQKFIAENLLEKHGIEYTTYHSNYRDPNKFTTQDRYASPDENDTTDIWLDLYSTSDNNYTASVSWELAEDGAYFSVDNVCPPDGAAIYWNQNYWQPATVGRDNFKWAWSSGEDTEGDGSVTYGETDIRNGGIVAKVDDPDPNPVDAKNGKFYGGFATDLKAVQSNASDYPVKGQYKHTWRTGTSCVFSDYGVSLSAGGISIDGGSAKEWSMATQGTF